MHLCDAVVCFLGGDVGMVSVGGTFLFGTSPIVPCLTECVLVTYVAIPSLGVMEQSVSEYCVKSPRG